MDPFAEQGDAFIVDEFGSKIRHSAAAGGRGAEKEYAAERFAGGDDFTVREAEIAEDRTRVYAAGFFEWQIVIQHRGDGATSGFAMAMGAIDVEIRTRARIQVRRMIVW